MGVVSNPLPIPDELWDKVPPDAQAAIAAAFLAMQQRISDLEASALSRLHCRVADLTFEGFLRLCPVINPTF
jgi:hypothetical protein